MGNNLFSGGIIMKELFSSAISVFTSLALISSSAISYASAAGSVPVDSDLSRETLYLDEADDLTFTAADTPLILSNFSEGTYNYKDFLDENNTAVYEALEILTTPQTDTISVTLPQSLLISLSALPSSKDFSSNDQEAYESAIFGSCKPGIDTLTFDMPEICWMDISKFSIGLGKDTTVSQNYFTGKYTLTVRSLKFTPSCNSVFGSVSDAQEYVDKLNKAIEDFPVSGDTRQEQLLSIHDYISQFTYYDTNADFASSALGALVEPGVVCEGYSKGFKLICDRLGIPCVLVFGNYNRSTNTAHMWDYVQMEDGKWYAVDVTWDDLDNDDVVKYQYFLKGSDSFNTNHTPESAYNITNFTYPELSAEDYSPATQPATTTTTTTTTSTTAVTSSETTSSAESTTTTDKTSQTTTTTVTTTSTTESTVSNISSTTTTSSSTTTTTEPVPEFVIGDVNKDGKVNLADLVLCHYAVLGNFTPEFSCDANGDGKTNALDIAIIRHILLCQ